MPTPEEHTARVRKMAGNPDRYYQPTDLGPTCRRCLGGIPKALNMTTHPGCFKVDEALILADRNRMRLRRVVAESQP